MKKTVLFVPVLMLTLAGCGKHEQGAKGGSQVVAKVNGTEITVHQLNFALSKLGKLDQSQLKPASEKVLQQLIDLELFKQQSIESKLDRDPNVLQVLEATKQQVLAQAYMQKVASKQSQPSNEEINSFYQAHPELFSDRSIYVIQEFLVKDAAARVKEVEAGISPTKTADEVAKWLRDNGFEFAVNASRKSAEQLPLPLAKQLNQLKTGDTVIMNNQGALALLFLDKIDKQPVSLEQAKPAIQQFIMNAGQQSLVKGELDALHKKAKVEFYGEFKDVKLGQTAAAAKAVEAAPAATTTPEPAQDASKQDAAADKHSQAIEKGLSGL